MRHLDQLLAAIWNAACTWTPEYEEGQTQEEGEEQWVNPKGDPEEKLSREQLKDIIVNKVKKVIR